MSAYFIILFLHHYYDVCVPKCTFSLYMPGKYAVRVVRKHWTILSGQR